MASLFNMTVTPTGKFQKMGGARYCEPYVLVTSIDLRRARPEVEAFLYGPWPRTNLKDTAGIAPLVWRQSFWKLDITAAPIEKPDDVIFLIALMEHADGNPSALRLLVKKAVIEALDASALLTRDMRIARLTDDINRAVDFANGGPNFNSAIEIVLRTEDVTTLNIDGFCKFVRSFCGYGGDYCLSFELIKAESQLKDLVSQTDKAFACAAE
jgi:hypothetical protein